VRLTEEHHRQYKTSTVPSPNPDKRPMALIWAHLMTLASWDRCGFLAVVR
jgi:hypothetical protein